MIVKSNGKYSNKSDFVIHMQNKTQTIWETFCCQLIAYILNRVSDPSLADDIFQDVFLKIHSKIDTLKDDTKIRSWVYQIARNTIIDHYRKQKIKTEDIHTIELKDENMFFGFEDSVEDNPAKEIAAGLREMVEALPQKYAKAILWVEFEGLSQIELAKKLGISISGAKSRVQRARQMLRDSLMKCCHFQFDRYGTIIDSHPIACCCCQSYFENR